ncbi:tRNA pseudouridine synthase 3, variant 3 [Balamuthia mandrillaris]
MEASSHSPQQQQQDEEGETSLEELSKEELLQKVRQLQGQVKRLQAEHAHQPSANKPSSSVVKQEASGGKRKKKKREFTMSNYSQRYVAIKLAYLGWGYQGLAMQDAQDNSIERHLLEALTKARLITSRESARFQRCGRTDKGVSALGNVISLLVRSNLRPATTSNETRKRSQTKDKEKEEMEEEEKDDQEHKDKEKPEKEESEEDDGIIYKDTPLMLSGGKKDEELNYTRTLNNLLPPDIRVLGWAPVHKDFSSRFSTRSRTYKYFFLKENLNIEAMREAAQKLVGCHDFRNFCRMDVLNVHNYERTLLSFEIDPFDERDDAASSSSSTSSFFSAQSSMYQMTICGYAFLWHQVRDMAAVLFLVGQGLESPSVIDELLDVENNQKPTYQMASEVPLVLYDAEFEGIDFIYEAGAHRHLEQALYNRWQNLSLKTAVVRCMLHSLDHCMVYRSEHYKQAYLPISSSSSADATTSTEESAVERLQWKELRRLVAVPESKYVPLMQRWKEDRYETKVANLSSKKRKRFEVTGGDKTVSSSSPSSSNDAISGAEAEEKEEKGFHS